MVAICLDHLFLGFHVKELLGHESVAATQVTEISKLKVESDGGTIFLDEVGELPLSTQVRLLRILENGEFIKVGSSKVQKTCKSFRS